MRHHIKLRRLYNEDRSEFIVDAEPLPAAVWDRMTDEEMMDRRDAERDAITAEWARIRKA